MLFSHHYCTLYNQKYYHGRFMYPTATGTDFQACLLEGYNGFVQMTLWVGLDYNLMD